MIALILSPFALAAIAPVLLRRAPARAGWLAIWPALLAIALAVELREAAVSGGRLLDVAWAPSLGLSLAFHLDGLGLLFAVLITAIGALVVWYASQYLHGHPHAARFYPALFVFMGAMLGVALSDNILTLFVFWELTGFSSFLLIGFEHEREDARSAALQALLVTAVGGLALLAAGLLIFDITGTTSLAAMRASRDALVSHPHYAAIAALVLLAAFTKSAQVPFHFWLPNAMAAPTPVSAYLHSATMVKAGVYLIARMTPVLGDTPLWTTAVTTAGAATLLLGAYRSVQETDLKRILAYSTLSALGVLTMLLGVGTAEAIGAAVVYLVAHAGYKGALFLVAGVIDHETGTRDVTRLGGLRQAMPITAFAGLAAAISMAGVPLTLGFLGKDAAYAALLPGGDRSVLLLALLIVGSVFLGVAGFAAGLSPFQGQKRIDGGHDPSAGLWMPPMLLAVLGVIAGILPWMLSAPLSAAAAAIVNGPVTLDLAVWHGLSPAVLLSAATLLAVAGGYAVRHSLRRWSWRPAHGTEALYTATMTGLTRLSRVIAPPLHSASLRSYVMVIVTVSVVLAGAAVVTAPSWRTFSPALDVRVHELLVVVMMLAGAVSAAMARSTMAAVLSLGVVGYGVAMTFLFFGAPDLAMTQFSVETLTVFIYVLVFRHFRNLGGLSPRAVRYRDAAIAAAIGTLIGGLVLVVSTTDTAARLREYFVAAAPTLGHGRNVVNVILVDFRGFDTLGEITVLATAAIGVRALLGMHSGSRIEAPSEAEGPATSTIFRTAARLLMPLLLLFAVFLLLRGHNEPGGGFVGGLVAAAAFALYALAFGVRRAHQALPLSPLSLIGTGLTIALGSGLLAALRGQPFMTAQWLLDPVAIGTPAVFDVGVFLVVAGVVLMMIFSLSEEH